MTRLPGRFERRLGWGAVLAGAVLALVMQVAAPVGVPLYDGVVVQEPYRFLHPAGGQAGEPSSYTSTFGLEDGVSPVIPAATTESPPQAQLIARVDAFVVPAGATSLQVSISPIEPPPPPEGETIAGNVYRFSVTDQAGQPAAIKPCDGCISLVMRAPEDTEVASIKRFADGAWQDVETVHAGVVALYQTNPTVLGDYAVIESPVDAGADPLPLVLGAAGLLLLVAAALFYLRGRAAPGPVVERGSVRGRSGARVERVQPKRVPSKRKGARRPPSGRSDQ